MSNAAARRVTAWIVFHVPKYMPMAKNFSQAALSSIAKSVAPTNRTMVNPAEPRCSAIFATGKPFSLSHRIELRSDVRPAPSRAVTSCSIDNSSANPEGSQGQPRQARSAFPHARDGVLDALLHPLHQLTVGQHQGLLHLDLDYDGLLSLD